MNEAVNFFAEFELNEEKELKGTWVPYRGDVEFLIARNLNKAFRRDLQKQIKRSKKDLESKDEDISDNKSLAILIDTMSEHILLGWKGPLQDKEGKPIEYNKENAKNLLKHELFRRWVNEQADNIQNFLAIQEGEDEGN